MSSFGSRRKARVIKVDDDGVDDAETRGSAVDGAAGKICWDEFVAAEKLSETNYIKDLEQPQPSFKLKSNKSRLKQSNLRKAVNADSTEGEGEGPLGGEDDDGPVVIKPKLGGQKQKKKPKSRLSFGLGNNGEDEEDATTLETPMKKSTLGLRAAENSAVKRGIAMRGLPTRTMDDDDDRPKYSKEYLEELQSSTPTTPMDTGSIPTDTDEMELDASELEGAMVVDSPAPVHTPSKIQVLTDAEIQERKERRARLAQEQDFLSVEDDDDGRTKKKDDTRLVVDEDQMGEGFDEFVEDGGVSLGKRAEKQRRKQDRRKMAELINAAEGNSSESSSDSDAERRIAYESTQTRAGMDGMKRPRRDPAKELLQIPAKITPLPSLAECITRLKSTVSGMEAQIQLKSASVEQMRTEKQGISTREKEVQALLDETGKKYQEAMAKKSEVTGSSEIAEIDATPTGAFAGDRGPESLGSTPGAGANDDGGVGL